AYALDKPTGNPRPCGSSRARQCWYSSFTPRNAPHTCKPHTCKKLAVSRHSLRRLIFPRRGLVGTAAIQGAEYIGKNPPKLPILPSCLAPINCKLSLAFSLPERGGSMAARRQNRRVELMFLPVEPAIFRYRGGRGAAAPLPVLRR